MADSLETTPFGGTSRFPKAYDPANPQVAERRRKLFEQIAKTRTPETDEAMNKIASRFMSKLSW